MVRKIVFLVLIILICFSFNNNVTKSAEYNLDFSGCVDYDDLKILADFWLNNCNTANNWCNNADFDQSSKVDFSDYSALAAYWQKDPGLLGWWLFNETSGSISFDESGNANNANLIGEPARVVWDFGNSLSFNGIDQYVIVDNESFFDITGNITITCWIKKKGNSQACTLVSKSDSFQVFIGKFSTVITFSCAGTGRAVSSTTNICDNKWHHVAAVYDGSAKKIFIDGVFDKSIISSGSIVTNDYKVTIASDEYFTNQKLQGIIGEVRIYNQALSTERIRAVADEYFALAHYAKPADNATYQLTDLTLMWTPGRYAVTHDIYFGNDFDAVDNATHDSNEYIGNFVIDANSFSTFGLEYETNYYWRIDEVNDFDD